MTIVKKEKDFKIEFNGKSTYMITDSNGDSWGHADTLRKATNRLNKILSNY
jgi:hypothetical protein